MSADNGIYILRTIKQDNTPGQCFEYRVKHYMAVENIFDYETDKINLQMLKTYFGDCLVLNDKTSALILASELLDEYHVVEYGIQVIKLNIVFPH